MLLGLVHVEHDDRHMVILAKAERGGVHDLQPLGKRLGVGDALVARGGRVLHRVGGVDAVHLGRLEDDLAP